MDTQKNRENPRGELMDDSIIGIFLSDKLLRKTNTVSWDPQPKLRRFIYHGESIRCSRLLGSGEHGVVLLTSIKGAEYALKVFKEWSPPYPVSSADAEAVYSSPLARESRALARLDSYKKNGKFAVWCFGWMKLSDPQFEAIGNVVSTDHLSRWAIVKKIRTTLTDQSHIDQIFENFKIPKELGIFPQDIRIENYSGSEILDLSCALTYPCPKWTEFEFNFFYEETMHGVYDWFPRNAKEPLSATSTSFFTSAFALVRRTFCVADRLRRL